MNFIETYVATKILDEIYKSIKEKLEEKKCFLKTKKSDFQNHFHQHTVKIYNWSKDISFTDLENSKLTLSSYVPLDYYVVPRSLDLLPVDNKKKVKLETIIEDDRNVILIGQPGSGKTTTMKYLSQLFLTNEDYLKRFNFLIVVRLRDVNALNSETDNYNIVSELLNILGIYINFKGKYAANTINSINDFILVEVLEKLKPFIILDGYDEIQNENNKQNLITELNKLSLSAGLFKFILTTRSGEIPQGIKNSKVYEICALTPLQVRKFATYWLKKEVYVEDFLEKISNSPYYDASLRPLTIAHLCAIYERYKNIPPKPKTVYRKVVNLLIEEWDTQRGLKRISNFNDFDVDREYEFLSYLSFYLSAKYQKIVFTQNELFDGYLKICSKYGLEQTKAIAVFKELESHNGLIIQNSYDTYEFAHKSLQEYLCADYIVKLPLQKLNDSFLFKIPNELAIAVALSSEPETYFSNLILNIFSKYQLQKDFVKTFLMRLLIEKPDFTPTLELGISTVKLFSDSYLAFEVLNDQDLLKIYKSFFDFESVRESVSKLKQYYEVDEEIDEKNCSIFSISQAHKIQSLPGYHIPMNMKLLEEFYGK